MQQIWYVHASSDIRENQHVYQRWWIRHVAMSLIQRDGGPGSDDERGLYRRFPWPTVAGHVPNIAIRGYKLEEDMAVLFVPWVRFSSL